MPARKVINGAVQENVIQAKGQEVKQAGKVERLKLKKKIGGFNMKLNETTKMMESEDFKERFKAEYYQLKIRIQGLNETLKKYKEGTLTFKPKCSYDILNGQLKIMNMYASYLEERAKIENIELN
ncbi:hypothetical protein MHBO_003388 [Bonamia ostreae]|uniref:Uncharacterized protein n=1 Tax=Bonamia ostreae TaxID=126728 RepID=A0ABV2AQA1_9EUKA